MKPPPSLGILWPFLEEYPETMFIFKDAMACLTYERDVGQVMYLIGAFDTELDSDYNTHVMQFAKEASMN